MTENIMSSTSLLAFLYAIPAENVQGSALTKLATQLRCKPVNWGAVQEKLDAILNTHPKLQQAYTDCKRQLETKTLQELLALLPSQEVLNQYVSTPPATRSGPPGDLDTKTIVINNIAEAILDSDKPAEMAKKLLQPLDDKPKSPQQSPKPVGNH